MSTNWSQEIVDADLVAVELETAGFDFRNIQQAVDQPGEVLGAAPHHLDRVGAPRRDGRIALQDAGIAEDRVERRA